MINSISSHIGVVLRDPDNTLHEEIAKAIKDKQPLVLMHPPDSSHIVQAMRTAASHPLVLVVPPMADGTPYCKRCESYHRVEDPCLMPR